MIITVLTKGIFISININSEAERAKKLHITSKNSYSKLIESSSKPDIESWWKGEGEAQQKRAQDVCSMDYFAMKTHAGEFD